MIRMTVARTWTCQGGAWGQLVRVMVEDDEVSAPASEMISASRRRSWVGRDEGQPGIPSGVASQAQRVAPFSGSTGSCESLSFFELRDGAGFAHPQSHLPTGQQQHLTGMGCPAARSCASGATKGSASRTRMIRAGFITSSIIVDTLALQFPLFSDRHVASRAMA